MCYFKRIENTLKQYLREIKAARDGTDVTLLKAQIALLQEILAYIKLGNWAGNKNAYDRIMYTLKYGVEATAEKYDTTVNCIYAGLSKAAMRVQRQIGKDVLRLIREGDVEYARFVFYRNTNQLGKLLLDTVIDELPRELKSDVQLEDCDTELKHLKVYTPWFVDRVVAAKCDKQRLAYIHRLLTTKDDAYMKQQFELYKKLKGATGG